MTVKWRIQRFQDSESEWEEDLTDVSVTDAVNRFGRQATAYIYDIDGEKKDKYPRGTGIQFEVLPNSLNSQTVDSGETVTVTSGETIQASSWETSGEVLNAGSIETGEGSIPRFAGFVVENREGDRNGADVIELECYSFDHFLRRETIERDFEGETFFDALEEIITDFTPINFDPDKVNIVNNDQLTRTYRGEKVDEFLNEISSKSANEEYGVDSNLDFFFRRREFGRSPRDIDNTQWIDYNFPEEGKQALNELQVFYGEGDDTGSVIVDNGEDKQELQDNLGLDGPGVLRDEVTFEDIDNASDARDKGREILDRKDVVERGEVSSYELFETSPGDSISVEITPLGISQEFRIAEIEYNWLDDETVLQLVEKRENDAERLVEITDTLDRVERRNADRDAIATRYISLDLDKVVDFSIKAFEQRFDKRFIQLGHEGVDGEFSSNIGHEFPDNTETSGDLIGNGLEKRDVIIDE